MSDTPYRIAIVDATGPVIHDLEHLGSDAQIRANQKAQAPANTTLPVAHLQLHSPKALSQMLDPTKKALILAQQALLTERQRVEFYERGQTVPWQSFELVNPNRNPDAYTWDLIDQVQRLQDGHTERQEWFNGKHSDIFLSALKDWDMVYGDDFATLDLKIQDGSGLSYAQAVEEGGGTTLYTDPFARTWAPSTLEGMDGVRITNLTTNVRYFLHNRTQYPNAKFEPGMLLADMIITAAPGSVLTTGGICFGYNTTTRASMTAEFGVDVSAGAGQMAIARLRLGQDGTVINDVPIAAGIIESDGTITLRYQLKVWSKAEGVEIEVDGQEIPGAVKLGASAFGANGAVGAYAINLGPDPRTLGNAGGGSVFLSRLYFDSKAQIFVPGVITATTTDHSHQFNESALLDVCSLAAGSEDFDYRKNPKSGWRQDTMDLGPALGVDTQILFAEATGRVPANTMPPTWDVTVAYLKRDVVTKGRWSYMAIDDNTGQDPASTTHWGLLGRAGVTGNLLQGYPQVQKNRQKLASELRVSGKATGSTPKIYYARDLAAMRKYGRISLPQSQPDVQDFASLRRLGQVNVRLSARGAEARTAEVILAGIFPGLCRELDTVLVDCLSMDLDMSRRRLMGIDVVEGRKTGMIYLDQYPASMALNVAEQLQGQINKLAAGATQATTPADQGGALNMPGGGLVLFRAGPGT